MDDRTWLHLPATGGYFHCPADAVEAWKGRGWQESEPPAEPNPAVAEYKPAGAAPAKTPVAETAPAPAKTTIRKTADPRTEGVKDVG